MVKLSKTDINNIATSAFEFILEDVDDYVNQSYDNMSSKQQKDFILRIKDELNKQCDNELKNIEKNWTDDSAEIKQLKNKIKKLEAQIYADNHSWSEDMGF